MKRGHRTDLKALLDLLLRDADMRAFRADDPVSLPRRFADPRDIEIAGWLASSLAYGRVELFMARLEELFRIMGPSPFAYVSRFDAARELPRLRPVKYRFHGGEDIAALLHLMHEAVRRHGTPGRLFTGCFRPGDEDTGPALERFIDAVTAVDTSPVYGRRLYPRGLMHGFPRPSKGSACKRFNLYLRWMIRRDDGVDFGLWKGIPPSKLIIPLDTHILRIGRLLGLTRRKAGGWAAAKEITRALGTAEPDDPLKYDFVLCHLGISGACPANRDPDRCRACVLCPACAGAA